MKAEILETIEVLLGIAIASVFTAYTFSTMAVAIKLDDNHRTFQFDSINDAVSWMNECMKNRDDLMDAETGVQYVTASLQDITNPVEAMEIMEKIIHLKEQLDVLLTDGKLMADSYGREYVPIGFTVGLRKIINEYKIMVHEWQNIAFPKLDVERNGILWLYDNKENELEPIPLRN